MNVQCEKIFNELFHSHPDLMGCNKDIASAYQLLVQCYSQGGKVLVCGNGGSASDSEHIVGELMKGFLLKRRICKEDEERIRKTFPDEGEYLSKSLQGALPALSLVSQTSISTAVINDVAADMVFAQQVYGYAQKDDVLMGLSTSGDSKNIVNAIRVARAFGVKTIGLTGESGGLMKNLCDVTVRVPSCVTYKVQEYHLPVYHALCAMVEAEFFKE